MVVKRRKRRPLTAKGHVRRSEIPGHRRVQRQSKRRPIPHLKRALRAWGMRQRLPVKADQIDLFKPGQDLLVRGLNNGGGGVDFGALPRAQSCADHTAFLIAVGAISGFSERQNARAIRFQNSRIHPIQRGSTHGT